MGEQAGIEPASSGESAQTGDHTLLLRVAGLSPLVSTVHWITAQNPSGFSTRRHAAKHMVSFPLRVILYTLSIADGLG